MIDFDNLSSKVVPLADALIDIEEHPSFDDPDRLGDQSSQYACLDAGFGDGIHG